MTDMTGACLTTICGGPHQPPTLPSLPWRGTTGPPIRSGRDPPIPAEHAL